MKRFLVLLITLTMALAGCATDDGGDPEMDTSSPTSSTSTGVTETSSTSASSDESSTSTSEEPTTNETEEPYVAPLEGSMNLTFTNGVVPSTLNLTFDAFHKLEDGSESRSDIFWTLTIAEIEVEEFGDEVPSSKSFELPAEGNYTVKVVFEDLDEQIVELEEVLELVNEVPPRVEETFSCNTAAGLGVLSLSLGIINLGGCSMGTLSGSAEVIEIGEGSCGVQYDRNGDGQSDGSVDVGTTYEAGDRFTAFCAPGDVDVTSSVTVAYW